MYVSRLIYVYIYICIYKYTRNKKWNEEQHVLSEKSLFGLTIVLFRSKFSTLYEKEIICQQ